MNHGFVPCKVARNADGTCTITGNVALVGKIAQYQSLPASWRRRIDLMIASAASESQATPDNVIAFPLPLPVTA